VRSVDAAARGSDCHLDYARRRHGSYPSLENQQPGESSVSDLQAIQAIEAIKQLKYRYFRSLDCNDWELFASCLSEDCRAAYSDGKLCLEGRDAIVGFMRDNMSGADFLSMHHGHHPEITLEGADNASGIWYLEDRIISLRRRTHLYGAAIYEDRYRREEGVWRIAATGYRRTFEILEPLPESAKVLSNMFAGGD
jgi:hypothetical protein